ncbi:MAG: hypothetical protein FJ123_17495 [Deltaproteobacteria bacterium]|nr:hypothetical protein [Deltaproteobacteria bacterium]
MKDNSTQNSQQIPPSWADDSLSKFIQDALGNIYATFHNLKTPYNKLKETHDLFAKIVDNIEGTPDWFAAFFLARSHSAFLGAVRLALSGQVPEAFMVIRGCLENALYGLYVTRSPSSQETWLRRHDDEESKKKVRREFKISNLLDLLEKNDKKLRSIAGELYERTIDYGGHPNEKAFFSVAKKSLNEHKITIQSAYLIGNEPALQLCLKSCAQIGLCSLSIFQLIYKERFDILGLSNEMKALKKGL